MTSRRRLADTLLMLALAAGAAALLIVLEALPNAAPLDELYRLGRP